MVKTKDWFFAGLVTGAIGGAGIIVLNTILLLLGVKHGTYWQAMGGLFYNTELLQTWSAQLHGIIDALGVSAANGVLLSLAILLTGKDFFYAKSVSLSAAGAYFLFIVIYPHTGLGKDSLITPWIALLGHTVFNGLLSGYILARICTFNSDNGSDSDKDGNGSRHGFTAPKSPSGP